jgi:hypothetical protein
MWVRMARVRVIDGGGAFFTNTTKNAPRNEFPQ